MSVPMRGERYAGGGTVVYYNDIDKNAAAWLREVLQHVADAPARVQAWLRAHGVVFEDLEDRWQRVGVSLYNEIVEMSALAKAVLDEEEAEGTKPDAATVGRV